MRFTWVIDGLGSFAYEGDSYSVVFKKPSQYKLTVSSCVTQSQSVSPSQLVAANILNVCVCNMWCRL